MVLCPGLRMGKEVNSAIRFVDIIECGPATQVGFVSGMGITGFDVAGILVPRKTHSRFGPFNNPLFVEEMSLLSQSGPADFGHQVAEEKLAQACLLAEAVGDEVAAVAVI